jgi:hypothetical protein
MSTGLNETETGVSKEARRRRGGGDEKAEEDAGEGGHAETETNRDGRSDKAGVNVVPVSASALPA